MTYTIRPIEIQDLPQAYTMLVALIECGNIGRPLEMGIERMEQEMFGPKADWYALVAVQNSDMIGLCCYSFTNIGRATNSTPALHVDNLYVHQDYRRQGIGEHFFQELQKIAQNAHISRIQLNCFKNNPIGQDFYHKLGAEKIDYVDVFRLNLKTLTPDDKQS